MLTREQLSTITMFRSIEELNNFENSPFSVLPNELISMIANFTDNDSDIAKALKHAVAGKEEDVTTLMAMLEANPRLVLQAGNVIIPGGSEVARATLLECALGAGDPILAAMIMPYFLKIKNADGQTIDATAVKEKQLARYRPHIEALAKQIESKQPAYDLKPLIEIIKTSSAADIIAALNINAPNVDMTPNTPLRAAFAKFRKAVRPPKKIAVGMHYKHYTTLMQAFDLLYDEWESLSNNYTNYDKCNLVWWQIIGYLQRSLPSIDRFAFARAFNDEERTLKFKHGQGSFPDTSNDDSDSSRLGSEIAIFGRDGRRCVEGDAAGGGAVGNFMSDKNFKLAELIQPRPRVQTAEWVTGAIICQGARGVRSILRMMGLSQGC